MTEGSVRPRPRRVWKYLLIFGMACVLVLGGLGWYATTDSFQAMVRKRLVGELERITGGRVDVGSVHTVPFQLQVEVRDLTIHGRESPAEVPYAHVDRLIVHLKITSVLTPGLAFQSVFFERPVIHVVVYPDGTTNQPSPKVAQASGKTPVQDLFALSINQLQVRHGELLLNDQSIPLDFTVDDVSADMSYSLLHGRYEASLLLGKATTKFQTFRPIAWTAAMHFRLSKSGVEVRSLEATSGHSHVQLSGTLSDFAKPKITGKYDATIDLQEASAISRKPELRRGVLEVSGQGFWASENFSSAGNLQVRDADWRNASLNFHGATLKTKFSVDSKRLAFPDIAANIFGGVVTGNAEIGNWQSLARSTRALKARKGEEQKATVHLKLRDLSGSEIASGLTTPKRPFSRMNVVGAVDGTFDAGWTGSPSNVIADVVLDVAAPARPKAGQLAVNGHTRATYRRASGEIEVSEFTVATNATQVRASGTLSASSAVKFSVSTSNLGEWQPILVAVGYDQPLPIKLRGPASFNGTATGRLSSITFAGKLQSGDFDFVVPATSRTPEKDLHWDSLAMEVRISPAGLGLRNGMLHRDRTAIAFDINVGLEDRQFTASSPFTARINMAHADLAEVFSMTGYDYPATGTLDLSVQLAGSRAEPEGQGRVHIANATIHGQAIDEFSSALSFSRGEVILHNLDIAQSQSRVSGDGSYIFSTHSLKLDLAGTHFDLASIPMLQQGRVTVQGGLDFTAHASGTLEQPVIDATIRLRNLTLDQELAGDFTIHAASQSGELRVSGVSQFKDADLSLEGTVHPSGDWQSVLDLHFKRLDVDSILKMYLRGHITGHSAVAGDLHLQGPLLRPGELNLAGNLSDLFADIENVKLRNEGPVRFAISNHVFKVEQFHLLGDNTDLSGDGSVQLTGEHQLDFRARGQLNLQLIRTYDPDFTSAGTVTVDMTVAGTTSNPIAQGRMQIANGSIAYANLPNGLSAVNGSLTFTQNRFDIETLSGHVGGGSVAFRGNASLYGGQINFDLGLHGEGVRLRYPQGVSSTADLDVQFAGNSDSSTLSGAVTITKVAVTPGFDFGAYLQRTAQSSAIPQTNSLLNRIRLDVHIVTMPDLQMQTAVIRLSGDADLHLRGTAAKPVLLGRADVLEGQAYFNGTKYRLERGDVTFSNPVTTTPVVDLQASTQVRDYDITLNLNGSVDKLNLTYRSEPPLPTADIIALLAFGQTTQQSTQLQQSGGSSFNQEASNAILAAALNATVSNRVQRLFGVSRIKVDPQGLSTETSPTQSGPAITIEQQVASNITISYSTNVSQTSQQVIQAEYNISRNISVVAIRDQNGVVSFDVRIRQRRK
jgi:translocation and assembly module TamB